MSRETSHENGRRSSLLPAWDLRCVHLSKLSEGDYASIRLEREIRGSQQVNALYPPV